MSDQRQEGSYRLSARVSPTFGDDSDTSYNYAESYLEALLTNMRDIEATVSRDFLLLALLILACVLTPLTGSKCGKLSTSA